MLADFALLDIVALALYLAAAVCYGAAPFLSASRAPISDGAPPRRLLLAGRLLLSMGIVAQFASIGLWCVRMHRSPFSGEFGTLSVLAWTIALAYLAFDVRYRLPAVGAGALPVACVALFWGLLHIGGPISDSQLIRHRIVSLHVFSILFSFALFALAFACAGCYLMQNHLLKERRARPMLYGLPPLVTLDKTAYLAVIYALPLLTLGLALGIVTMLHSSLAAYPARWLLDPHNFVAFVTWLLYVLYLTARLGLGWRGVRLQYILVAGLLIVLALYLVPSTTHHFSA